MKKNYIFFAIVGLVVFVPVAFLSYLSVRITTTLPQAVIFSQPVPLASAWLGWNSPEEAPREISYDLGEWHMTDNVEEYYHMPGQEVERLTREPFEKRHYMNEKEAQKTIGITLDKATLESVQKNGILINRLIFRNKKYANKARERYLAIGIFLQTKAYIPWWIVAARILPFGGN